MKKSFYDVYDLQAEIEKRINKKFKENTTCKSLVQFLNPTNGNGSLDYYFPSFSALREDDEEENEEIELTDFEKEVYETLDQICKEEKIKDYMRIYIWW